MSTQTKKTDHRLTIPPNGAVLVDHEETAGAFQVAVFDGDTIAKRYDVESRIVIVPGWKNGVATHQKVEYRCGVSAPIIVDVDGTRTLAYCEKGLVRIFTDVVLAPTTVWPIRQTLEMGGVKVHLGRIRDGGKDFCIFGCQNSRGFWQQVWGAFVGEELSTISVGEMDAIGPVLCAGYRHSGQDDRSPRSDGSGDGGRSGGGRSGGGRRNDGRGRRDGGRRDGGRRDGGRRNDGRGRSGGGRGGRDRRSPQGGGRDDGIVSLETAFPDGKGERTGTES